MVRSIPPALEVSTNAVPAGYSMTLFQSLATSAGYDPVRGPGTSCLDADASGQCVVPWAGGHKAVSSVVLVANGVSFAVSIHPCYVYASETDGKIGHDLDFHHDLVRGGLRHVRTLAATHPDSDLLGRAVREHVPHVCALFISVLK